MRMQAPKQPMIVWMSPWVLWCVLCLTGNPLRIGSPHLHNGTQSLRLTARKAQRTFGSGFLNAGYLAACLRDSYPYRRTILGETQPVWEPIFEPDAAMLSLIGDGAVKINQAIPGFFNADGLRDLTGIRGGQND